MKFKSTCIFVTYQIVEMASHHLEKIEIKVYTPVDVNPDNDLDWCELEHRVVSMFNMQFEKLMPLVPAALDKIYIHVNLFYNALNEKIAAFNFAESHEGNFIFELNAFSFHSVHREDLLHETVLHEIIHSLDIQVILENRTQFLASKNFNLVHRKNIRSPENSLHDFSVQWAFLHFFATIRNEGVAILSTKIMQGTTSKMQVNEQVSLVASDVSHALGLCKNSLYHKRVSPETVQSTLTLFEHHSEDYADCLLYQFTFAKLPAFAAMSYSEFLDQEKSPDEKLSMVSSLFEFDLSDWIRALLKDEQLKNEISHTDLFTLLYAFDREKREGSVPLHLLSHGYNNNYSAFLSLLKSCIEVTYNFDELIEMHVSFYDQTSYDDLLDDLKVLSQRILDLRDETNSELVDLSLTYLFQKEDLIQDHSPIIGYQDDWIVLEGAYALLLHQHRE